MSDGRHPAASTPLALVRDAYQKYEDRIGLARERHGRPLTFAEKVLFAHHDDPDVAVLLGAVEGHVELVEQAPALGVAVSRAVEGDEGDATVDLVAHVLAFHHILRRSSSRSRARTRMRSLAGSSTTR